MMKPAVQEVMDSKPEDQPDTTVPVSQPVAEVKQDVEMMDPTVPEPDIEAPPMLVEETPVEPTDMDPTVPKPDVEAPPMLVEETPVEPTDMPEEAPEEPSDPYVPFEGFTVFPDSKIVIVVGNSILRIDAGCVNLLGSFNGVGPTHVFKWQRRENDASPWIDIPETEGHGICGYAPPSQGPV